MATRTSRCFVLLAALATVLAALNLAQLFRARERPGGTGPHDAPEGVPAAVAALLRADKPPAFYEGMAQLLLNDEDPAAAAQLLRKAVATTRDPFAKARLLGELAKAQVKAGRNDEALASLAEAVDVSPETSQKVALSSTLARYAEQYDKPQQAIAAYQYVLDHSDQDWLRKIARSSLLRLHEKQGDLARRVAELEERLARDPADASALEALVDYHRRRKQDPAAAAGYQQRLVDAQPDRPEHVRELADILLEANQYDRAALALKQGLEREPKNAAYYYERLSRVCREQGDRDGARAWAVKLAETSPGSSFAVARAAELIDATGQTEDALTWMERAIGIEKDPTSRARLYLGAAGMADRLKRLDRAEEYYKAILASTSDATLRDRATRGIELIEQKRRQADGPDGARP